MILYFVVCYYGNGIQSLAVFLFFAQVIFCVISFFIINILCLHWLWTY